MPATIDRCSAGVWIAAAGRCLDLPTWCRPARTYHWPGSWATIFIRLRRLKRKRKSCRKQRARIGPVCSITIRTNLWDELRKPKGSYEALLLKANIERRATARLRARLEAGLVRLMLVDGGQVRHLKRNII